jgi:ParB family chromosome partitioning protein
MMDKEKTMNAQVKSAATQISIRQIHPFRNHPFKVLDDDRMKDLVQSIQDNGILNPVLVRPDEQDGFEMISGHRRMHAAKLAGLTTVPAIIKEMTDDEAVIAMVDSNMQREEILPSERAFSLKMKMDAMRRQGKRTDLSQDAASESMKRMTEKTSGTEFQKLEDSWSREEVGQQAGISGRQVQKYLRLTELTEDLLNLVDQKKLSIVLAVEISRFSNELQRSLYSYIQKNGMIKKTQLDALKKFNYENLTEFSVTQVLNDAVSTKEDDGKVVLSRRELDKYFSKTVETDKRKEVILDLLDRWKRGQKRP